MLWQDAKYFGTWVLYVSWPAHMRPWRPTPGPANVLDHAVYNVIVLPQGEHLQLVLQLLPPLSLFGQEHLSGLKYRGNGVGPLQLVPLGSHRDYFQPGAVPQGLAQGLAGTGVLDEDAARPPPLRQVFHRPDKLGKLHPVSPHMQ